MEVIKKKPILFKFNEVYLDISVNNITVVYVVDAFDYLTEDGKFEINPFRRPRDVFKSCIALIEPLS